MNLPRFNAGQVGNLTFEHMNEICSVVERVRPLLTRNGGMGDVQLFEILFARITNRPVNSDAHEWVEVTTDDRNGNTAAQKWVDVNGGRRSGSSTDENFQPAFGFNASVLGSIDAVRFEIDDIVCLVRNKATDGRVVWIAVTAAERRVPWPARITGIAQQIAPKVWSYYWEEVEFVFFASGGQTTVWATFATARRSTATGGFGPAINGCEQRDQSPFDGSGPGIATAQPIPVGTVVQMSVERGGVPFFSIPNPHSVNCT